MKKLILFLLTLSGLYAQGISNPIRIIWVTTAPTVGAACANTQAMQRSLQAGATNGHLYSCQNSLWADLISSGGGGAPGGMTGNVQTNDGAGGFAGSSGFSYNDTTKFAGLIGGLTVGQTGTATGEIDFNGTTSGTAKLKPADAAGTPTITLPGATGTLGLVAGASGQIPYNNGSGAYGADSGLAYNSSTHALGATGLITSGQASGVTGGIVFNGVTSGSLEVTAPDVAGTSSKITLPLGITDFSATGGTSQVVKQVSAGAPFTVGQLACSDLSSATALCSTTPGTGVATFLATPSGANLASALTSALPISKGGTGQVAQQAAFDALAPTATRAGDITYWNGTHYVNLAGNNSGTKIIQETSSGVPSWVDPASASVSATTVTGAISVLTDSGSANAYIGCDSATTAPFDGLLIVLKPAHDNTGGSTYNHCASGAKPIQTAYGAAMLKGAIMADGAASPSGVLLRYSSAAAGGAGAWQNLTLGQVQLAPQTTVNANMFPRADGAGLTQWATPSDPGDGRRTSFIECDGRHWDIPFNSPGYGAAWQYGSATGTITGSASTGSGTQSPGCTLTSSSTSGDNVYYNNTDDKIFATGRNLVFDVKVALGATTSTRNWIGFTGGATSAIVASATPSTSGFVGFRYDTGAGDSSWQCVVASASATVVDSTVTPSTNQVKLKFIEDSTNNAVHFFIDGTEVCLATAVTNLPAATFMSFAVTETTLSAATRALTMNWAWIQGDK